MQLKPVQIDHYSAKYSYTLTLNIEGTYYMPQEVIVFCTDREMFRGSISEEGGTVTMPVQVDEQGMIDIRIELPDAVSPGEIEHTGDTRKLALRLLEMSLTAE